ncbi:MAG: RNA polymerase sigma factor [Acutalibacter sp.]
MDDRNIVELFWQRSPQALDALDTTYGSTLRKLAENLLGSRQDAEECVNDAYLGLWEGIPPAKPNPLLPYALKVVRNLCLKRYHWNTAKKRFSPFDVAYTELEGCLAGSSGPEEHQDLQELRAALESFLRGLSQRDRQLFLGRYWYGCAVKELALRLGMTESNTSVRLSRLRDKLRKRLLEKGVLE